MRYYTSTLYYANKVLVCFPGSGAEDGGLKLPSSSNMSRNSCVVGTRCLTQAETRGILPASTPIAALTAPYRKRPLYNRNNPLDSADIDPAGSSMSSALLKKLNIDPIIPGGMSAASSRMACRRLKRTRRLVGRLLEVAPRAQNAITPVRGMPW